MHERGHNDVLKGNEHEFFRRMGSFLDTVKKQQQQHQQQQPSVPAGLNKKAGSDDKEHVREAVESDEIRRSSTVKAMTSPSEAELRQACKRLGSSVKDEKVESNEILLTMDLTASRRI